MYCLTKYEMKFGDVVVPARTKGIVINKITTDTVNAPGVYVSMAISNHDINKDVIHNEKIVQKGCRNVNSASLFGVVVDTNTSSVCMDASDKNYFYTGLYDWQLERIFGKGKIPENLIIGKHKYNGKDAKLRDVVDYLEDEFSEWVQKCCEFYTLTEEDIEKDIEDRDCFDGAEAGDTILSPKGLEQFYAKQLEYQNKLETTGFTYDFKGGLI